LANWLSTSYLPERILGSIAQAEKMPDGVQEAVRVLVVFVRLGNDRADGRPGMVEKLVLEPHGHVGNRSTIGLGKVGTGGKESVQLALTDLVGMIAQLLEQKANSMLVSQGRVAGSRLAIDNRQGGIDSLTALKPILLGLSSQVIDMVEHDLIKLADPGVKIARDGNIQNQS
jgi:hypothetical protein